MECMSPSRQLTQSLALKEIRMWGLAGARPSETWKQRSGGTHEGCAPYLSSSATANRKHRFFPIRNEEVAVCFEPCARSFSESRKPTW